MVDDSFPDTSSFGTPEKADLNSKTSKSTEKTNTTYSEEQDLTNAELAERRILAFLINYPKTIGDSFSLIFAKDFSVFENARLFTSLKNLYNQGDEFDEFVVGDSFSHKADISPSDAIDKFNSIKASITIDEKEDTKDIVKRFNSVYARFKSYTSDRSLTSIAADILKNKEKRTPEEQVAHFSDLSEQLTGLANQIIPTQSKAIHLSDKMSEIMGQIKENLENGKAFVGLDTGFDCMNEVTSGYRKGDFVLLGGRPSMGKTAYSIQQMVNMAVRGIPVLFFSIEMPHDMVLMRIIATIANVPLTELSKGQLSDGQWKRVAEATETIKKLPFTIDSSAGVTISYIEKTAKEWYHDHVEKTEDKHGLICVDYLQLISSPSNNPNANKNDVVSEVSRRLKMLARNLDNTVLALTQLNRSLEQRTNKRPVNSDLRDSGQLEQDADIIIFVYRDEVYNSDSQDKGIMESIISKQRNGPLATIRNSFHKPCQRIEDVEVVLS